MRPRALNARHGVDLEGLDPGDLAELIDYLYSHRLGWFRDLDVKATVPTL